MSIAATPSVDVDLFADPVLADPYEAYRALRDAGPAVYLAEHRVWVLARYREVRDALHRHLVFSAAHPTGLLDVLTTRDPVRGRPHDGLTAGRVDGPAPGLPGGFTYGFTGGPAGDHPRLLGHGRERLASGTASASIGACCDHPLHGLAADRRAPTLAELEALIADQAARLVDELMARGSFDAVADLAYPFPLKTIGDLIGLPADGRPDLMLCAEASLQANAPLEDHAARALLDLEHVFALLAAELAAARATTPAAPPVTAEVAAPARHGLGTLGPSAETPSAIAGPGHGDAFGPDPIVHLLKAFAMPCVQAVAAGLTGMLWLLATHPEAWHALRVDPSLVPAAVEESLRLETPVQIYSRTTTRDVHIGGTLIRAGERVLLLLGAANRDPRRWPDPDAFDVHRDPTDHLGFGYGTQASLCATLTKTHLRAILDALVRRADHLYLDGSPRRRISTTTRAFASLPLHVTPW